MYLFIKSTWLLDPTVEDVKSSQKFESSLAYVISSDVECLI